MNHTERCDLLTAVVEGMGFSYYLSKRGKSSQPSDCDVSYLLYRGPSMIEARNYQMFRIYVHDTKDIAYARVNIPGVEHGLGMEPLEMDLLAWELPGDTVFIKQLLDFCSTIPFTKSAAEHLIKFYTQRQNAGTSQEEVPCKACKGTGKMTTHTHLLKCKVCNGKKHRIRVTETYFLSPYGEQFLSEK
jgi:hypothetical protein